MLGTVIAEYTAIDADDGDFGSIVYTVSSAIPDLPFAINPESGELAVNATLDFETNTLYVIEVIASNPDGQQSTSTTTFVSIVDENDNPPIFSQDVYSDNVTEHSAGGTAILTVTASDADSADNGEIVFSIVSGNLLNFFAIDTISGGLGVIRVAEGADINREIISFFNLTIRANDLGSPQMEDFAQVIIMVNDINDNAPVFLPGLYLASVREDVDPPSEVLRTFAIDLDQPGTPNSQIDYAITGGNVGNVFALNRIDNSFAALVLVGSLDFETQPTYRLVITAMDRGTPQLNGTADVVILVTDVNTEPPTVEGNQTVPLSELTPVGTEIARINATDFDSPQIMFIINSVTGDGVNGNDGLGFFSINDQGVITLDQPLDFEQNLSYEIEIIVTDGLLSSTTTVLVTVIDANEFDPVFNDLQPLQVQEELPAGTVVGTVQATDDDRNSTVTYSIIMEGPSSALFTIDSQMGIIRTNQTLDREDLVAWDLFLPSEESSVVIRVQAVDSGTPSRFSIAEVTIMLIDINDNAPVFDMITDGFQASVFEERPAGTLVVNAFARDLDLGSNGDVNYTLEVVGFADVSLSPFEIDPETGLISTTRPLDRESVDSYTFFVRAFDGGLPSLSVNATVDVAVLDVNDNAPIFLQPSYNLFVLENAFVPQQLLQVQAEDADLGSNAQITYSIRESTPINSVNLFSIDPNNGTITLVSSLDFEAASSHRLVVAADDSVNSNTTEVIVAVGNVDETPPEFFGECVVSIPENVPAGIPITQCTARDFDDSANVFRAAEGYAILSGNTNGTFSIANDGTVTLERSVDREAIPFFTIVVQAFDRVGLTNTTLLRVTITDINDNQPVLTNIPETRLVTQSEIQSQETNFFTVEASDADSGLNADLVYSLTSNIINDTTTELTITVADQGSPAMSATAILTYRFEVPCTLQVHSINESSGQVTSQLLCTISIQPLSNDLTFGTDLQLMCNVLRNVEATFEFLHNGSLVTSAIPLNPSDAAGLFNINNATFQDAGEYACKVTVAEVGSLQSDNAVVRIQVPPVVTIPPVDAAIELGRAIMFNCFATGVPQPTYTWSRRTAEGLEIVMSGPRVIVSLNFLVISPVVAEDQGVYICTASNRAGVDEASATLSIISQSNVIAMSLRSFSNPNQDQSCNIFSSSSFENAMTTITGVTTLTTEVNGTDLCEESACTPSPCMNGGECSLETEAPDGYVCTCSIGYTGVNCESDINECDDGPCQFGGSCTNTDGSFTCECRSGFTGHRCQYTSVCMETQNACPENQTCVETISNSQGFVCQDMSMTTDAVVVTGITLGPGNLDDQVNSIQEMSEQQAVRKRRQVGGVLDNNGFVTSCEARFMPVESDRFVLVWACPEGVEPPSQDELDSICRTLYDMGLVGTCSSPSGLQFNSAANDGTLPDSSIEVFFVLVDDNGRPLTGAEAMALLKRSDVLARLREYGYLATGFSAVVPPSESKLALPPSVIAGLAVALLLAVLLSVTIFVIVCLVKRRHSKKKAPPKGNHSVYQLTPKSSLRRKADQSRISQENLLEDAGPSITIKNSSANDSCDTPLNISTVSVKDIFDDGIYGEGYVPPMVVTSPERSRTTSPHQRPPSTEEVIILPGGKVVLTGKVSKRSSLERFAGGLVKVPSLKRRTESQDNLLDDDDDSHDYDDVIVNKMVESHVSHVPPPQPRPSSSNSRQHTTTASDQSNVKYRDEEIYGNLLYTKAGAMGNAGERWESYWKTRTLLRTQNGKKEKE